MALFCLTTLEGFVIHHHSWYLCFKDIGGLHIFCIPAIMALLCLTTLEGFVIHHHSWHLCFKEYIFNFHWNHRTEILSTIVLYLISIISILISRCWSSVLSFVCLTCTPSMSFTSSSISTPSYTSSLCTSPALTSTITSFSLCTAFASNNRCHEINVNSQCTWFFLEDGMF